MTAEMHEEALRLGFLVHDLARLQRVVQDRLLKPLGLTRSQWGVLLFLSRRDGMTQTALAVDLDLTKPAIGGLLERMESAGFIERRPDASDARIRRVYLTRAGHRQLNQVNSKVAPLITQTMGSNTEEEMAITIGVLHRIRASQLELIGEEQQDADTKPKPQTPGFFANTK